MNTRMEKNTHHHSDTVATPAVHIRHKGILPRQSKEGRTAKLNSSDVKTAGLEAELRQCVQGEVRFDEGSRALYATDGSNYRQVPIGVVIPQTVADIVATV